MASAESSGGFECDLRALAVAIERVSAERDAIHGGIASVRSTFGHVEGHWRSPAGNSFVLATTHFNSVTDNVVEVLDEAIGRMRKAYQNYASTEACNTKNLRMSESSANSTAPVLQLRSAAPVPDGGQVHNPQPTALAERVAPVSTGGDGGGSTSLAERNR